MEGDYTSNLKSITKILRWLEELWGAFSNKEKQ